MAPSSLVFIFGLLQGSNWNTAMASSFCWDLGTINNKGSEQRKGLQSLNIQEHIGVSPHKVSALQKSVGAEVGVPGGEIIRQLHLSSPSFESSPSPGRPLIHQIGWLWILTSRPSKMSLILTFLLPGPISTFLLLSLLRRSNSLGNQIVKILLSRDGLLFYKNVQNLTHNSNPCCLRTL